MYFDRDRAVIQLMFLHLHEYGYWFKEDHKMHKIKTEKELDALKLSGEEFKQLYLHVIKHSIQSVVANGIRLGIYETCVGFQPSSILRELSRPGSMWKYFVSF